MTDTTNLAEDLAARWLPTIEARQQAAAAVRVAVHQLGVPARDVTALVPMIQPGKERGIWTLGQAVETIPGVILVAYSGAGEVPVPGLLDYHEARNIAETIGRNRLAETGRLGTTGYAAVDEDGEAAVFEGVF
jgi:hypothetical protein